MTHINGSRTLRRLFRPMRWSVATRRVFLVLLPLSLPAWAMAVVAMLGLATMQGVGDALSKFWSEPPRPRGYNYYGHYGRS